MSTLVSDTLRRAGARIEWWATCDRWLNKLLVGQSPIRARSFVSADAQTLLSGRRVLITGASSGIGRALALKLAELQVESVLVARSIDKLRALQSEVEARGGRTRIYSADLSSAPSTDALLAQLALDGVTIDVLVNNAGRSIRRPIAQADDRIHDFERTMALNYYGATRLILGLLPGMRHRRRGSIVNVSSAGVQLSTPLFSAYVASKAALDASSRVAARETRADGVRFSTVHMPLVRTPMVAPTPEYDDVPMLSPEQAAELVLRAICTRDAQLGTWLGTAIHLAYVLAPNWTEAWMTRGDALVAQSTSRQDAPVVRSAQPKPRVAAGLRCHDAPPAPPLRNVERHRDCLRLGQA